MQDYLDSEVVNALERGIANVEIEGLKVDNQMREWCLKLLENKITYDEYITLLKEKAHALSEKEVDMVKTLKIPIYLAPELK